MEKVSNSLWRQGNVGFVFGESAVISGNILKSIRHRPPKISTNLRQQPPPTPTNQRD